MADAVPLPCKTLVEVAEMLRDRTITSLALTESVIAHIEALEPTLMAFACTTFDTARAEAAAVDAEIAAAGTTKGPMHGVPIALKDLYAVVRAPLLPPLPAAAARPSD